VIPVMLLQMGMRCSFSRCRRSSSRQPQRQQMNQPSLQVQMQVPLGVWHRYECLVGLKAAAAAAMQSSRVRLLLQQRRALVLQQMRQQGVQTALAAGLGT
jgi:hypothetical protein